MTSGPLNGSLPLSDIKVVDFSRLLPGPWCTQLLADLGAEVIKVERPGAGDPSRYNPPLYGGESVYFCNVNMGKTSVAIDLASEAGQRAAMDLVAQADVMVESFKAGSAAKLGIGWDAARERNPRLVYCSITGFGQSGPLSHIAGHDLAIQAMSGVLGRVPDRMPALQGADYAAGAMATIAILAALRQRDHTGEGRYLDIGMLDSLVAMGAIAMTSALSKESGGSGEPAMEVWGKNPRYDIYRTRDGREVAVALLEAEVWGRFCREIGREDLVDASESLADRVSSHGARGASYRQAIAEFCAAHDRADLAARMLEVGLPITPVLSPEEALAHPNMSGRDLVQEIDHPTEGRILVLAAPLARTGLVRRDRVPNARVSEAKFRS